MKAGQQKLALIFDEDLNAEPLPDACQKCGSVGKCTRHDPRAGCETEAES